MTELGLVRQGLGEDKDLGLVGQGLGRRHGLGLPGGLEGKD